MGIRRPRHELDLSHEPPTSRELPAELADEQPYLSQHAYGGHSVSAAARASFGTAALAADRMHGPEVVAGAQVSAGGRRQRLMDVDHVQVRAGDKADNISDEFRPHLLRQRLSDSSNSNWQPQSNRKLCSAAATASSHGCGEPSIDQEQQLIWRTNWSLPEVQQRQQFSSAAANAAKLGARPGNSNKGSTCIDLLSVPPQAASALLMSKRQLVKALNGLFLADVKTNLTERVQEFTDCPYTKHEHRETIITLLQCIKFQLNKFVKLIYRLVSVRLIVMIIMSFELTSEHQC